MAIDNTTGDVLASSAFAPGGDAKIHLPLALASRVEKLVLDAPPQAGAVLLLDGTAHAALVGLAAGAQNAQTAYLGALFFARLALPPGSQPLTGTLENLIAAKASAIILADVPLTAADQQAAVATIGRVLEDALVQHLAAEMLDQALAA